MSKENLQTDKSYREFCGKSKAEVAAKALHGHKEKLAFLSALFVTAGSLVIHGSSVSVTLSTRNRVLSDTLENLTEDLTGRKCKVERAGGRNTNITVENALWLLNSARVLEFGEDSSITVCPNIAEEFVSDPACAVAYVRGAYLGGGSLSLGKYHLEFSFTRPNIAEDFVKLLAAFDIRAKLAVRGEKAVAYVKGSQGISDALALMGAAKAVLGFNEVVVGRQMTGQLNRKLNCDMHNIDKQIETSMRQCAHLSELDFSELTPPLAQTARIRIDNPEASYEELAELLGITKSGLKNRLKRLEDIYRKIKEEK